MRALLFLAMSLTLMLAVAAQGGPKPSQPECPAKSYHYEDIEEALRTAESCVRANEVLSACSSGAGGDVGYAEIVIERCEKDFLPKLGAQQRSAYKQSLKQCRTKYARKSGTMYASSAALCAADVAVSYAKKAAKAAPRAPVAR